MECNNHLSYDINKSSERLDAILNSGDENFCERKALPSRDTLTYTNGYYVNVSALFIDIVDSSDLPNKHKRPVLAKIYRCFLSEITAVFNSVDICKEISINGDCVWGVFETPCKSDIDKVFSVAAKLNSLVEILNYKLRKKGYEEILVGIGIDYGRALMIKAGYSGSGLNDVIWMGDVVNSACHLANEAGRSSYQPILISSVIYNNLNKDNKSLVKSTKIDGNEYYHGNIINSNMQKWYRENCK